jgi:hypothetical protein
MNSVLSGLAGALKTIAPTLATMIGGPLAGGAVTALESAFGLDAGAGPDAITKVIQTGAMTPEIIAKVREADQAYATKMKSLDIDLAKINADHDTLMAQTQEADLASARTMQETTKDWVPQALALVVTAGFFGILGWMLVNSKTLTDQPVLMVMLGSLATAWASIVNFYYGSSAGAKKANEALSDIAKAP